ncbi:C1 family peptidase [Spirosoma spitsbergense]|uniref:C1 family peptidase n=1 Tax=Spirosoma spitsbergense TaxID=431554 RepID=UPI0003814BAD|nr:C1 family peptidase [Spirosoma spitsbergense]
MATQKATVLPELDARPDTLDFRDKIYVANLYEVPTRIGLDEYKKWEVPILDQGQEGACTGFGLATVANYLLRRRKIVPDPKPVSSRMLYEMAKRYDEWPGEDYSGSSARGAMKGWHKHGVCGEECYPYNALKPDGRLTQMRTSDALKRPLGAYYRVNHKDLVSMHSAMAEVGILYATASVHDGWRNVSEKGVIDFAENTIGGHAFAIVAYDDQGFWIQNSWGVKWGSQGFGLISYDDWLANGTDVWVARLGAPVTLLRPQSIATSFSAAAGKSNAYSYSDLRPHIVSLGNDGTLEEGGDFGTTTDEVRNIFQVDFPRVTEKWPKKRLLLYAHGGLVDETAAVQRLADYRQTMLDAQVYPISFIWHSDFWSTATNILQDALRKRRPEGILDASLDFMLDRLDDALEPLARVLTGKAEWDEMKENALQATVNKNGGVRFVLEELSKLATDPTVEIHVVGHSAGSTFHAPLVRLLTAKGEITSGYLKGQTGYGLPIESCTLWAPACTIDLFKKAYLEAIKDDLIRRFALFTLTDKAEQDDNCAQIYHKSLLYLVSNAFEARPRIPIFRPEGEPILGMTKFLDDDKELTKLFKSKKADWILAPNTALNEPKNYSTAHQHGDFDDDKPTVKATLARILDQTKPESSKVDNPLTFYSSSSSLRDTRQQLTN